MGEISQRGSQWQFPSVKIIDENGVKIHIFYGRKSCQRLLQNAPPVVTSKCTTFEGEEVYVFYNGFGNEISVPPRGGLRATLAPFLVGRQAGLVGGFFGLLRQQWRRVGGLWLGTGFGVKVGIAFPLDEDQKPTVVDDKSQTSRPCPALQPTAFPKSSNAGRLR
jgi:hypothetical protein